MGHFRVELDAVEPRAVVRHRRERRIRSGRDRRESRRQRLDAVTVAHPDVEHSGIACAFVVDAVEQARRGGPPDLGVAELTMRGRRHAPAELGSHRLHAIADAEHRHTELEYRIRRARGRRIRDRLRTAGQDDSAGTEGTHGSVAGIPGEDFAIDADLANAPRDQLRVLSAEVEDQDAVGMDVGRRCLQLRGHHLIR